MATDTKPVTPGTKPQAKQAPQAQQAKVRTGAGRPVSSPRHTRPAPPPPPRTRQAQDRQAQDRRSQRQRMPFILLLVGLLGGALVSLLVISTTLDEGAYRINTLTSQNDAYYKEWEVLSADANDEANPAVIAKEAYNLGLRQDPDERFINPATGKILVVPPVTPQP